MHFVLLQVVIQNERILFRWRIVVTCSSFNSIGLAFGKHPDVDTRNFGWGIRFISRWWWPSVLESLTVGCGLKIHQPVLIFFLILYHRKWAFILPLKDHQYLDFQAHVAESDSNVMQSSLSGTDVRLNMIVLCSLSSEWTIQRPFARFKAFGCCCSSFFWWWQSVNSICGTSGVVDDDYGGRNIPGPSYLTCVSLSVHSSHLHAFWVWLHQGLLCEFSLTVCSLSFWIWVFCFVCVCL